MRVLNELNLIIKVYITLLNNVMPHKHDRLCGCLNINR